MESWTLSKDGWKDDVYNRLEFDGVDDYVEFPSLDTSNLPYFHMSIDMEKHDAADSVSFEQFVDGDSYVQLLWHTDGRVYGVIRDNTTSYGYVHIGDTGRHTITMVYQGYLTGNANRLQVSVDGVDQTLTFVGTLPSVTPDLSSAKPTLGVQAGGYVKGIVYSMHTRGIAGELLSKWDNVIGNEFIDSIGGDKNGIIYGATVDRIDYSIDKSGNDNVIMPVKSYCAENDGTAGQYIETPEITVDVRDGILLECEAYYTQTSGYGTLFDFGRVGNDRLGFIVKGTQIIYFFKDESGDTVIDNTTPLSYNNQYLKIALYVSSTEYYFSINGTIIDSGTITTNSTTITQKSYFCCRLGTLPLTGKVWNCKINGGAILNIPLQGSCYDNSGNGNHGTNNGCDLTAVQDEFHYNLKEGFGYGINKIIDGDMEESDTSNWVAFDATLSKVYSSLGGGVRALRITAVAATFWAMQAAATVGVNYRITGWARSDGSEIPQSFLGSGAWIGTNSTEWQYFEYEGLANSFNIGFGSGGVSGYVEFNDVKMTELPIPRLADNSGFADTVAEEHLAGTWNNMPESYFRFPTTLSDDIMDKSDVGIWSADIRASVHYDSLNKNDWHSSELVQAYLDDNINPTYKNRIFVADNNTTFIKDGSSFITDSGAYVVELGDGSTQSKQVLVYNTEQTGEALEKIIKYLSKEY